MLNGKVKKEMIEFYRDKTFNSFAVAIGTQYTFHFFPKQKEDRFWGYRYLYAYDGNPTHLFGVGRFLLIAWFSYPWEDDR